MKIKYLGKGEEIPSLEDEMGAIFFPDKEYKVIENHVGKRTKERIKDIIELMTETDETQCEPTLTFSHADIALMIDALNNYIGENNE